MTENPDVEPSPENVSTGRSGVTDDAATHSTAAQRELMANLAREIEEFVASAGWNQAPQLFALVPTSVLLEEQPDLAEHLNQHSALTPVAQDALPQQDLAEALNSIAWPDVVMGCALVQEIVVLPPSAEAELPDERSADAATLQEVAANHPERTETRLVAVVHRDGSTGTLLRLRTDLASDSAGGKLIERPDLAPRLSEVLLATLTS